MEGHAVLLHPPFSTFHSLCARRSIRPMDPVKVYGAGWCEDTHATRAHLDALGIDYQYIDVDADPEAQAWVAAQNNGKQKTPTVAIGGRILIEPENDELDEVLRDAEV